MAVEMENFYCQMDNRLTNIKNFYSATNIPMEFPVFSTDNVLAGVANSIDENPGNIHSNKTFQPNGGCTNYIIYFSC